MAKLNTTVSNIELQSNKVTAGTPASSWTDSQYPSAKALYNAYSVLLNKISAVQSDLSNINSVNFKYPIGSIIMTTTSINPQENLGGTWELIDKSFANAWIPIEDAHWNSVGAIINQSTTEGLTPGVSLTDHTITFRLNLKMTSAASDGDLSLGSLDLKNYGITRLNHVIPNHVAVADGGNATICYTLSHEGAITITDVLNISGTAHTLAIGQTFIINLELPVQHTYMDDNFCNKFYWRRIA